ncbi:hypothetical protein GCM10025774_02360 [Microbacterium kyungheense]|uniref:Uncharacterized protein n=2 Tax=Microbacterium kyungheense TaxID=1263636 RepID=A0A543FK75_9MICO|nr:hypothetical protein FB391_0555 [Microbacterium kyungheense]
MPGRAVHRTPAWVAVGAWGAGLVGAAVGAGAIVGVQADTVSRSLGAAAVTHGLLALAWGAVCLARGRTVAPRAAVVGVFAGIASVVTLLATTPTGTSVVAVGVFIGLSAATGAGVGWSLRHPSRRGGGVTGLIAAAAVVALLVTPALGSAQDAATTEPDGSFVPVVGHEGH